MINLHDGQDNIDVRKNLIEYLAEVYNDENFIVGILSIIPWDDARNRMIAFLEMAKSLGDDITSDHVYAVALKMKRERVG